MLSFRLKDVGDHFDHLFLISVASLLNIFTLLENDTDDFPFVERHCLPSLCENCVDEFMDEV